MSTNSLCQTLTVGLRSLIKNHKDQIKHVKQLHKWTSSTSPKLKTFRQAQEIHVQLCSPDQLQPKPEVSQLKFGTVFTDHMLQIEFNEQVGGWQAPSISPLKYLTLHPAAKVLHYAVELFEGMKAYRGVDGHIRMFRPDLNMDRMNRSALRAGLPQFDPEEMIQCLNRLIQIDQEWVPHTTAASLYIRPTLIGTDPTLGVAVSSTALLYVILCPVGSYFGTQVTKPVSLLADPKYVRAWKGGCGDRKMGSNYGPTIAIQSEAIERGFNQLLWLYGEDHQVTEAGTMNIFFVIINDLGEMEMITPQLDGLILPGITRMSILELSEQWNDYKVTERKITMPEIMQLSREKRILECFGSGTACIISPIGNIHYEGNDILIPTLEQPNPICLRLLNKLSDIHYGRIEHPWARKGEWNCRRKNLFTTNQIKKQNSQG
uniref:Branched-chain-amino-acid aminotransferase n=2 Tax=Cacopsylla melanoneura TaxID=428564 RepID=A0A8D8QPN8_9HEMI